MRHHYAVQVEWIGNTGNGTSAYDAYSRNHLVSTSGRPSLEGSSDPCFRGDADRWNPEQLLVAALSQCHMLWYLHLCATAGIVVTEYSDEALGEMQLLPDGGGKFAWVELRPNVTVAPSGLGGAEEEQALALHERAASLCFIAQSVNFPVRHVPTCHILSEPGD